MSFQVTVNPGNHRFDAGADQTVLDAALAAGIVLPYGCRNGACGSCRGKVVAGKVSNADSVAQLLTAEEREEGYALFCQAHASSDLEIECAQVRLATDIQVRKMPVRVITLTQVIADVMVLTLQLPSADPFRYRAGQYVEFILKDGRRRSYSMASAPRDGAPMELHLRHLPGGAFTDHVFGAGATRMKEREILRVEGPLGSFGLLDGSNRPIVMLATGTGFAPIKAMVEQLIDSGSDRSVVFYWGGRRPQDLYMHELAQSWTAQLPNFRYVPVVSQPQAEDNWTGRTGYVQDAVLADLPDLAAYEVYACGSLRMVEGARQLLIHTGHLSPDLFFSDAFTSEADVAALKA